MKKISILLFSALGFIACQNTPEYAIVSGKLNHYNGMPISIVGNGVEQEVKIAPDGSFSDTLHVEPNYYTLAGRGIFVPMYLDKGSEVIINADFANLPESIKISGKDSLVTSYLNKKSDIRRETEQSFRETFTKGVDGFKADLDGVKAKYDNLLKQTKGLPKDFVAMEEKANNFYTLQLKSLYPNIHARLAQEEIEMPKEFADEISKIDLDIASDFDKIPAYKEFVINKLAQEFDETEGGVKNFIDKIKAMKSSNIKTEVFKHIGGSISSKNSQEDNDEIYKAVKEFVADSAFLAQTEERVTILNKLREGSPSPTFDFDNFKGGTTSLESLRGKLVYIDVWATWCGPCVDEIPALQALEKEYHGKDVNFVSISIDQNRQAWEKFTADKNLGGIQLYADLSAEDNFAKQYDIQFIPRFILLDKEGKIINADAPRPSDEEIKILLNANL